MSRVLFVDDEKDLAEACREALSLAGHDVTVANDGVEALRVLAATAFDLVITDLRMPGIDGFTVLRWIMSNKPNTKVIVMTAFGSSVVSDTARRLGALHCLSKPVGTDRLLETVSGVLGEPGFSAIIQNITVADYVQLCMNTGKTSIFEVSSGKQKGTIAIVDGTITHAEQGDLKGEDAFFEIISWEGGQINEKKLSAPLTPNIRTGGPYLLLEAFRHKDDVRPAPQPGAGLSAKENPPPPGTTVTLTQPSGPSPIQAADRDTGGERHPVAEAAPAVPQAPPGLDDLSEMLNRNALVAEYGIFAEQDFLRYKRSLTGAILHAAPSLQLKLGNLLKEELRCGALRYVLIHTKAGAHYMVFEYLNGRAVVGLKPGARPEDFWENLWPR